MTTFRPGRSLSAEEKGGGRPRKQEPKHPSLEPRPTAESRTATNPSSSATAASSKAPGRSLQLSEASLGFKLDPPDPLGRYTISATLTDEIAGEALTVEQEVEARDGP